MNLRDFIGHAEPLPVEERAPIVDSLLRSLNPPESEIDRKWAIAAKDRLEQIRSGSAETIPGEGVFAKIWNYPRQPDHEIKS